MEHSCIWVCACPCSGEFGVYIMIANGFGFCWNWLLSHYLNLNTVISFNVYVWCNVCIASGCVHVEALAYRIFFFLDIQMWIGRSVTNYICFNICNRCWFLKVCGWQNDKGIPVSVELEWRVNSFFPFFFVEARGGIPQLKSFKCANRKFRYLKGCNALFDFCKELLRG